MNAKEARWAFRLSLQCTQSKPPQRVILNFVNYGKSKDSRVHPIFYFIHRL